MIKKLSNNVLIYSGPGTCAHSVQQTLKTLKSFLNHSYDVKLINLDTLRNDRIPWDEGCALFVVPGGRDLQYLNDFSENVVGRIKGSKLKYLGICAGAYFGADRIEFEVGRKGYEVVGERPLKIVNVCARGCLNEEDGVIFQYSDSDPKEEGGVDSCKLIQILTKNRDKTFSIAYNGGCYFRVDELDKSSVFATYFSKESGKAAILLGENYCLSGVHFEYDEPVDEENKMERFELIYEILNGMKLNSKLPQEQEREREQETENNKFKAFLFNHNYTRDDHKIRSFNSDTLTLITETENNENYCKFNYKKYFDNLTTSMKKLKSSFIYAPVVSSTQTILLNDSKMTESLEHFSIFMADHQVSGRGRAGNSWISSGSCLQFTLFLKRQRDVDVNMALPLIQFLMSIALCEEINSLEFTDQCVKAKIKWPNDVYLHREGGNDLVGKIAGILVNVAVQGKGNDMQILIGVGVNLLKDSNATNLIHLNDFLREEIGKEEFLGGLLSRFRELYEADRFPVEEYYKNWIHSGQKITCNYRSDIGSNTSNTTVEIDTKTGTNSSSNELIISGIDEFGYLMTTDTITGKCIKFEPDGNSFDMFRNLIVKKQ